MSAKMYFTIGEVADLYGIPEWKIRRVVDALDDNIPRAGRYRLVPRGTLATLTLELQRQGWLPSLPQQEQEPCHA